MYIIKKSFRRLANVYMEYRLSQKTLNVLQMYEIPLKGVE